MSTFMLLIDVSLTKIFVSVTSGGSGSLGETYLHTPFMKKVLRSTSLKPMLNPKLHTRTCAVIDTVHDKFYIGRT